MFGWLRGKKATPKEIEAKSWTLANPPSNWTGSTDAWIKSQKDLSDAYRVSSIVQACVSEVSTTISNLDLKLMSNKGEQVEKHPALDLFYNNKDFTYAHIIDLISTRKALSGVGYMLISKAEGRRFGIEEIIPLTTDCVIENVDGETVSNYDVVCMKTAEKQVSPENMVRWINPDPYQLNGYTAPLKACLRELGIDRSKQDLIVELLENRTLYGKTLSTDQQLSQAQIEMMQEQLKSKYSSGGNRGNTAILPNGLSMSAGNDVEDIDFSILDSHVEGRICAVFDVPPVLIGLHSANTTFSNYETARKSFITETIIPTSNSLATELTRSILPHYGLVDWTYEFEYSNIDVLREDKLQQAKTLAQLVKSGMELEEAKEIVGL